MQKPILIDTAFVLALINRRDQHHQNALSCSKQFDGYPLLVIDAVLLEIGNALSMSIKRNLSKSLNNFLTQKK